jgi:hypothetical protein
VTEQEQNAMLAAYLTWSERETAGTREVESVPSSMVRAKALGAFKTGWRAAMEYAAKQGGPG